MESISAGKEAISICFEKAPFYGNKIMDREKLICKGELHNLREDALRRLLDLRPSLDKASKTDFRILQVQSCSTFGLTCSIFRLLEYRCFSHRFLGQNAPDFQSTLHSLRFEMFRAQDVHLPSAGKNNVCGCERPPSWEEHQIHRDGPRAPSLDLLQSLVILAPIPLSLIATPCPTQP